MTPIVRSFSEMPSLCMEQGSFIWKLESKYLGVGFTANIYTKSTEKPVPISQLSNVRRKISR